MVTRLANGKTFTIDYREKAPQLATATMFLDESGKIDPEKESRGWLTVGVPGSPLGLWTAHQKSGKLPWKRLVQPAIELAEQGFTVDQFIHQSMKTHQRYFIKYGEAANVYLHSGKAPAVGSTLKLPDLAETLKRIRDQGADGFYHGKTAELLEQAMIKHGGLVRQQDLAQYHVVLREPVIGQYKGHQIISMGPPSSGGVLIVQMLNILQGFEQKEFDRASPRYWHLLAETMKRAYLDRARHLGDPDFNKIPLDKLLSSKHADELRATISDRATSSATLGSDILSPEKTKESEQTTHYSIIDDEGNMVSVTTTLEDSCGSCCVAPGLGFLLNNEMHDFNVSPGLTNTTGRIGTPPNLIVPGKRMLSSMTPTLIVKDNKPFLIVGSPGGRTIPNTVLQIILNVIDHKMPIDEAVAAARMHHQWMPDQIGIESKVPRDIIDGLRAFGHDVKPRGNQGDGHSILIDWSSGRRYLPGTDRRLRGASAGY